MSKGMDKLSRRLHQFTRPGLTGAGVWVMDNSI